MRVHLVHCPDRGEHVCIAWVEVPPEERDAVRPGPSDILCLDAEDCDGPTCHLFSTARIRMRDRLRMYHESRPC
jgi:hypothetical protein